MILKTTGTVSATSLNLILTDNFNSSTTTFNGFNFRNLDISTEGTFSNYSNLDLDNLTINVGGTFTNNRVINAASFTVTVGVHLNNAASAAVINAASFTATVGEDFNNYFTSMINADSFNVTAKNFYNTQDGSTINATSFTVTVAENFSNNNNAVINADSLTVTAGSFVNNAVATIDAATVTIEVPNFADNIDNAGGTVSSDSLNFILTDDFTHESDSFTNFTNFSNLAITTEGTFTNNDTIDLDGNLTITANSFANSWRSVISDALALSVAGDFEHSGTITTNAYNLNIGGDFSYNDSANDFILGVNDTLTVLGEASIDVAGFANSGTITITDSLNVTANTFANSGGVVANAFYFCYFCSW